MEKDYIPLSERILSDPKVMALQVRYGNAAGLGHWVIMLLSMYNNSRPSIETNVDYIKASLMRIHEMSDEEFDELCDLCADLTLIDKPLWYEYQCISNPHVNEHKADREAISKKRQEAGRKGGKAKKASV